MKGLSLCPPTPPFSGGVCSNSHRPSAISLTLLLVLPTIISNAAVFRVTNGDDTIEPRSLRGAVLAANRLGGENTIIVEAPTNQLSIQGAAEEDGYTGDLDITRGRLTIIGAARGVTVSAAGLGDRVLHILPGAHATLLNLVITGGTSVGDPYCGCVGEPGGGILNAGILVMRDCVIAGNGSEPSIGAGGGDGGGICSTGTLTLHHCTLVANTCGPGQSFGFDNGGRGGAIWNGAEARLEDCLIVNNSAGDGGPGLDFDGGAGGGIFNAGRLTINDCKIINNSSGRGSDGLGTVESAPNGGSVIGIGAPGWAGYPGGNGAGVFNQGELILNNSTISGNTCQEGGKGGDGGSGGDGARGGSGGGIFNVGHLRASFCTISTNECGNGSNGGFGDGFGGGGNGGAGGDGGGIYNTGSLILSACSIAHNKAGPGGNGETGWTFKPTALAANGGAGGSGGGVFNATNAMAILIGGTHAARNSIGIGGQANSTYIQFPYPGTTIFGTPGTDGSGPDLDGQFIRLTHAR